MIDGLAYGAMPAEVIARVRAPIVALVHHPLCLEAGLAEARQDALRALETAALALARRVVVTSRITARTLVADFAVPADKITVAEPGTDPAPRAAGSAAGPLQLLSVGAIVPRKACDILVRALGSAEGSRLAPHHRRPDRPQPGGAGRPARGDPPRPASATASRSPAPWTGSAWPRLYASADAFRHGLPLRGLRHGAGRSHGARAADRVHHRRRGGRDGAGRRRDQGAAWRRARPQRLPSSGVLHDTGLRRRMADASWAAGQKLPRWEDTARIIAGVIEEVAQ